MKTIYLPMIAALTVSLCACTNQATKKPTNNAEKVNSTAIEISLIGTAEHAKMGAIVITSDNTYYIEGKSNWDKEGYFKKQIRVTGIVYAKSFKEEDLKNEKGEIMQGAVGEIHYIKMSKCELIK